MREKEEWFRDIGVEYTYMATDKDNKTSMLLFTSQCGYSKFRTLVILVHPHPLVSHRASVVNLTTVISLYHWRLSTIEFFPRDIDDVLHNPHSLGTFMVVTQRMAWVRSWNIVGSREHLEL